VACSSSDSMDANWDVVNRAFYDEEAAGMLFVWPDAIPLEKRVDSGRRYEYVKPPSTVRFEECWLLTIPRSRRSEAPFASEIEGLLRRFLTPSAQQFYL